MTNLAYPQIHVAIRTLIALVFLSAAVGKLRHFVVFQGVLGNYRLLPQVWVAPAAHILPPLEAAIAAGLLCGWASPYPQAAAMILLSLFALAMGINLLRGRRNIDCGCFQSAFRQQLSWILVLRNSVLVLLLQVIIVPVAGSLDAWAVIDGVLVGSVLFVILQSLDILWSIVPAWRIARRQKSAVTP
jgi:Methylamine utilisation protein MauE